MRMLTSSMILCLGAATLFAQDDIQRGRVKSLDRDKSTITLIVGDKERVYLVTTETRTEAGPKGDGELPGIKEGIEVNFKATTQDGKEVLVGIRPIEPARGGIQQGRVKKLDLEAAKIVIESDGKERILSITPETKVVEGDRESKERLPGVKEGVAVQFVTATRDGKEILVAIRVGGGQPAASQPLFDHSKLKALTEMGTEKYHDMRGGLYPNGNQRPIDHEKEGLARAKAIVPLDRDGKPDPNGKIVIISVGMSNTSQASKGFSEALASFPDKNPRVQFVDGAQGGMVAAVIQDANDNGRGEMYWKTSDSRLAAAKLTPSQVQVVWIKQADAGPTGKFPEYPKKLQAELTKIVQVIQSRYPNTKMVYLSSRTFAGYANTKLNPEPYAYESGFSVKWLIERQIEGDPELNCNPAKGAVNSAWLSWGPYLWWNGETPRADGFRHEPGDFAKDGTHHSDRGVRKLGGELLGFFRSDATTRSWFLKGTE